MPEQFLNMPNYESIYLNVSEYAGVCMSIPKPYSEGICGCFLDQTKVDFQDSSWKYLIQFLFKTKYFCKQNIKFPVTFEG